MEQLAVFSGLQLGCIPKERNRRRKGRTGRGSSSFRAGLLCACLFCSEMHPQVLIFPPPAPPLSQCAFKTEAKKLAFLSIYIEFLPHPPRLPASQNSCTTENNKYIILASTVLVICIHFLTAVFLNYHRGLHSKLQYSDNITFF